MNDDNYEKDFSDDFDNESEFNEKSDIGDDYDGDYDYKHKKGGLNPKHYIGKVGKSATGWAFAMVASTMGIYQVAGEITEPSFDDSTNTQLVQKFEDRMSYLKKVKDSGAYKKTIWNENIGPYRSLTNAEKTANTDMANMLADIMINGDGENLSEKDRMDLMNTFNDTVANLKGYGYTPLTEESAARLDEYTVPSRYRYAGSENSVMKTRVAQDMNRSALIEEKTLQNILYGAMFLPFMFLFPGLSKWQSNETLNRWSEEPKHKSKPPKFPH